MLLPEPSAESTEASRAWFLAREAARVLMDPSDAGARERVLENAHRMLRAYDATPDRSSVAGLHPMTQDAIDAGLELAFPGVAREEAVEALVGRIRAVAYPPDGARPGPDEEAAAAFARMERELDATGAFA